MQIHAVLLLEIPYIPITNMLNYVSQNTRKENNFLIRITCELAQRQKTNR